MIYQHYISTALLEIPLIPLSLSPGRLDFSPPDETAKTTIKTQNRQKRITHSDPIKPQALQPLLLLHRIVRLEPPPEEL